MKILSVLKTLFPLAVVWASSCIVTTTNADLIITEFLANPNGADSGGEYFELFNSGSSAIDIGTLTILDDGSDSIDLMSFAGTLIDPGDFVVFGNNSAPHVDIDYNPLAGSFIIANGADEIVVRDTASGTDLARLNYSDGDPEGEGTALVLDNTANAISGLTLEANYIAETIDTLDGADVGSPGVAGSTIIAAVPEPTSLTLLGGLAFGLFVSRRR